MSYDLAFWVGPRPKDDTTALAEFNKLYDANVGRGKKTKHPKLVAFHDDITARFPCMSQLPDDRIDESPWSDGPLLNNVTGPLFYLGMSFSRVEEVVPFLVERGHAHGLVVFDPQSAALLDPPKKPKKTAKKVPKKAAKKGRR